MSSKKLVVLGMLGTTLDQGRGAKRWQHWRPSVALCQHEHLLVDRFELLHGQKSVALAEIVEADLARVSPQTSVRRHLLDFGNPWALDEVYEGLFAFAKNYDFKPNKEDYLVHITTGTHIAQICMFLLTESRYFPARLLQTAPPSGGSRSGPGSFSILDLDLSKYDRIASRFREEQREGLSFLKSGIDTKNAAFNRLIERIEHVALGSRDPLLLTGPTGSGKSHLAQRIFELKKARRQVEGDLVELNCATVRGDGAMSALFGHARGAFTGAVGERAGMLKKAHGGVLFLDEIGELGPDEQAMLLRALEQGSFYPVGSDREVKSDFQLIAGTNRDLFTEVSSGSFREDLLARIDVWTFGLPGLAERPEDIEPNLDYELAFRSRAMSKNLTFSREARTQFLAFAVSAEATWPANFRDFSAAIRRMATLSPGGRIGTHEVTEEIARLRDHFSRAKPSPAGASPTGAAGLTARYLGATKAANLDPFDRTQLEEVLRVCLESKTLSDAGRRLFAISRTLKKTPNDADRLRKYLARFELEWSELRE
jgi:transcriptional regulatory protein RtcR